MLGSRGPADEWNGHEVATEFGSFASFIGYWVPMVTAMMLPGDL
jgi:purine-cytosine permease-like protein